MLEQDKRGLFLPNYSGDGITNLMSSLGTALTEQKQRYAPLTQLPPNEVGEASNVVLWVIDGLGFNQLQRHLPEAALTQYCRGAMTSVCPTTTASAIPTFLTGVPPLQHGLTGWFTYFVELGAVLTVLPFSLRLGQLSLDNSGLNPRDLSGEDSFFDHLSVDSNIVTPSWIAGSSFNRAFSGAARIRPYSNLKGLSKGIRTSVGSGRQRSYTYAYWPEYDSISHTFGSESEEAIKHLKQLDETFEQLLSMLKGTQTKLIVTADHGFIDSPDAQTIHLHEHPPLAETLAVPLCGEPRLAFCYVHADRAEQFEAYIGNQLSHACHLIPRQEMLDGNWFGLGLAHSRVEDRIGHYALVMKENYKITGTLPGERPLHHLGVHGGLSEGEMMVPLIVADL